SSPSSLISSSRHRQEMRRSPSPLPTVEGDDLHARAGSGGGGHQTADLRTDTVNGRTSRSGGEITGQGSTCAMPPHIERLRLPASSTAAATAAPAPAQEAVVVPVAAGTGLANGAVGADKNHHRSNNDSINNNNKSEVLVFARSRTISPAEMDGAGCTGGSAAVV
ncbi:unnamed protein product, partial [Sphacelaria rigidula]